MRGEFQLESVIKLDGNRSQIRLEDRFSSNVT